LFVFSFKHVRALQPRHLLLGQAGAKLRLGDQDAADLRLAPIPPNVAAFGDLVDVIFEWGKEGLVMTEHKFKIGQLVYFQPGSPDHARLGPYRIVRRLPESEGEFHYVIRSTYEDHERVARESQLTRA
jgi:hypothetical protein